MRRGFTLIEAIVALVLFQFGMLALAAAGALAARDLAIARQSARAQALARNRVELLRSSTCPPPGAGSVAHSHGLVEMWRVEAAGARRTITDSVDYALPRGARGHVVARAGTVCP